MFNKILFPTDFSDVSEKALEYIMTLKEVGTELVVVINVIDQRSMQVIDDLAGINSDNLERDIMTNASMSMNALEEKLKDNGFEVKSLLKIGFPVREILNAEKNEDISIIVIGSHGKSNLEEMFLGSVSEKVIRKCEKPVFVIKR